MSQQVSREKPIQERCRAIAGMLDEFRRYETDISASTIMIFMLVASKPGIRMKDLERATGLSSSAVHRNIRLLSDQHWKRGKDGNLLPGHDLVVAVPDAFDPRAKVVTLTPRGRKVMEKALFAIEFNEDN